jgi:hypothetical protein
MSHHLLEPPLVHLKKWAQGQPPLHIAVVSIQWQCMQDIE